VNLPYIAESTLSPQHLMLPCLSISIHCVHNIYPCYLVYLSVYTEFTTSTHVTLFIYQSTLSSQHLPMLPCLSISIHCVHNIYPCYLVYLSVYTVYTTSTHVTLFIYQYTLCSQHLPMLPCSWMNTTAGLMQQWRRFYSGHSGVPLSETKN
jgi:hypothetical protein